MKRVLLAFVCLCLMVAGACSLQFSVKAQKEREQVNQLGLQMTETASAMTGQTDYSQIKSSDVDFNFASIDSSKTFNSLMPRREPIA